MSESDALKSVQAKVGKVQDQMKENLELAFQRQENVDVLADKSQNLQASANQFSQVASRIREDQLMQQYKFYAGVVFGIATLLVVVFCWSSPGKLIIGLLVVGLTGGILFHLFQLRRQSTQRLADTYVDQSGDVELGRAGAIE